MKFRVNYGNGQVTEHHSVASAKRELLDMLARNDPYARLAFVQRYEGDGVWAKYRVTV